MFPKVPNGEVCSSWENDNEPAAEIVTTMLELTVDSTTSCNVLKQVRSDLCAFSAKQSWLIFYFCLKKAAALLSINAVGTAQVGMCTDPVVARVCPFTSTQPPML